MDLKDRYDVVVVGSGPAGAGVARALSGSGLETLIVECGKLPRYKMCSGIVFPSARKFIAHHFGELPNNVLCSPELIKGYRVYATVDSDVQDVPFALIDSGPEHEETALNTWRSALDYWLCSQSDADVVDCCRFKRFEREEQDYVVKLRYLEHEVSVRSKYLIGADGTVSRVRRVAFPGFDKNVGLIPNYEEIYRGEIALEPGWLYLFMDRGLTGYFATVFSKEDYIVVVNGVQQPESVKPYFETLRNHLEKKHGLMVKERTARHSIVLTDMSARRNLCLGSDNLLLVGEAGGFLRGGEGITSALVSGKAAGDAVVESARSGRPAIEHFRDLTSEAIATDERAHEMMSQFFGYNVFTRS